MSAINAMPIWYPPQFPLQGRLPKSEAQVRDNLYRRSKAERDHHDSLCVAAGRRVSKPCSKSLHITLCFDGTGNNLNHDLYTARPKSPTNIARMFRASIGTGYAGGTANTPSALELTDASGDAGNEYFKYYMPGVGTPFPELGDLDYSGLGLALAKFGEERINWALLMIIDALRRALGLPRDSDATLKAAVKAMGSAFGLESATGQANRRRQFVTRFAPLLHALRIAMAPAPGRCQLLGLQLYIYGFSRGAAAARAFVSWLNELLSHRGPTPCLHIEDVRLPVSVEYLGVLDTVASVGVADIIWGADGHSGWADDNQHVPNNALVKRCLHIVASHEQRLCFPLDSIRRETGAYPGNCVEVLHPGVHSDQGGGYPPGDQGKANGENDSLLLSQITLNDLYADAFAYGAPLKVPEDFLPKELNRDHWRVMSFELLDEFKINPALVTRFNAWRQVTLGLPAVPEPLCAEQADRYQPLLSDQSLEQALRNQMAWITAWRIDRYAFTSLLTQRFYIESSDTEADPQARKAAEAARDQRQKEVKQTRRDQLARERQEHTPSRPMPPGVKDFDADMAQTQLREAAEEFGEHYRSGMGAIVWLWALKMALAHKTRADLSIEHLRMKRDGQSLVSRLFPPPHGEVNHANETWRGHVDERRNAAEPEGLLRALFDDQVHDSRAWFLYSVGREWGGSYLRDRMVFFRNTDSRALVAHDARDQPMPPRDVGLPTASPPSTVMSGEQLAQAQDNIEKLFNASEVGDAPV